jgi:hypothetical protein
MRLVICNNISSIEVSSYCALIPLLKENQKIRDKGVSGEDNLTTNIATK